MNPDDITVDQYTELHSDQPVDELHALERTYGDDIADFATYKDLGEALPEYCPRKEP